jgi:hypothetical protein
MTWISIKDKMPPEGEYVLLFGFFGADIQYPEYSDYDDRIIVGCWEEGWWYIPRLHCDVPRKITHWMPLPEGPK